MNEIDKYAPMPPQLGPPLPGILKAYWPWVKQTPQVETPRNPSISYVDVEDIVLKTSTEKFRTEQKKKGLVPFYYE